MNDDIICHCVSSDCSNCPMRNIGTSGMKAEYHFFHQYNEKNNDAKNNSDVKSEN